MPYNRLTMAYDLADLDESTRARALTTYINPWHNPRTNTYGPAEYVTDAKPTEYKGFLIYERISGHVWDVVKDGRCVTQRAGLNGARNYIDQLQKGSGQ